MPPSPRPKPTGTELEERILVALRAAGGTITRNKLRAAVDSRLSAAELDAATRTLARRVALVIEPIVGEKPAARGGTQWRPMIVYRLPEAVDKSLGFATRPIKAFPPRRQPAPTATLEVLTERVVAALQQAGGRSQRAALRNLIRPTIKTSEFDAAVDELIRIGTIKAEKVTLAWHSPTGKDIPYHAVIYSLAGKRARAAK